MKKKHTPLVVGNWKMNPVNSEKAETLYRELQKQCTKKIVGVEVGICPPALFLLPLSKRMRGSHIKLGAQDVSFEKEGAHTGELSVTMLKSVGVSHVIVGHSERRAHGETDEAVAKKVLASVAGGLTTIVCVGEKERDTHGNYFGEIEAQLRAFLSVLEIKHLSRLVIAYEPVWAIGTGKNATGEDVHEMKLFIQKVIAQTRERSAVEKVRIIYGGSVNETNAQDLCVHAGMDGFLVGGASLKPVAFGSIVRITSHHGK